MKKEYFAYGSVLEALSSGLYPDKRHVIREFVQNAFDALNAWRKVSGEQSLGPIEIRIQKPSIFIADGGIGMNEEQAERFRYLGYSTKDRKDNVGFRGIGKDSGLAVAEKIIVTTSQAGIPVRYTIVIDAQRMLEESTSGRNPPLEEILEGYTSVTSAKEDKKSHYTFVELQNIRKDAYVLFDTDALKNYLRRNCPIPFDPAFRYADEITSRLKAYIPTFSALEIRLDGELLYKPFPENYTRPEYESIFLSDEEGAHLIAYCWFCGHAEKGQFDDKENSGLIYRIRNFAVGDRHLTRKTLWTTTPERAFYFFGEIHVLDESIVPSSDRTDFEDNEARATLFKRCRRIAHVLSKLAGTESAQRTFDESIMAARDLISMREAKVKESEIPIEVKPEVEYGIRRTIEDLEKRIGRTARKREPSVKDMQLVRRGATVVKKAKTLLKRIQSKEGFVDVGETMKLNKQARQVYQVVVDCLKEEFSFDPIRLEGIIGKINTALTDFFQKPKL
jgi:molecular chaperone HtpG